MGISLTFIAGRIAAACAVLVLLFLVGVGAASGVSAAGSGIASDDFNRCGVPGGVWSLVDPLGGGSAVTVGAGSQAARLAISVPGGVSHDPFNTNRAVRVMQPASNVDFQIEAKFDSPVTQRYQIQGLLVEQDAANWLRFDMYSDGSRVRVFAGSTAGGATSTKLDAAVPTATPFWLRVTRTGDTWTDSYSTDGSNWTTAGSFSRALVVGSVGVYGANAGSSNIPAHTALVDYFSDTAAPVNPEDGGSPSGSAQLNVTTQGSGAVTNNPASPYGCAANVTLTAQPAQGATFQGWSGDLTGSTNPATITLDQAQKSVTATFSSSDPPPQISNVAAVPTQTGATVSWTTNEPATSRVDYGPTTAYGANVDNPTPVTSHSVTLTGLSAGTLYHYRVRSTDAAGGTTSSADGALTTLPASAPTGIASDDFNRCGVPGGVWSLVDPLGGGSAVTVGAGSQAARLAISVPGGVSHDPFNTNRAVRVMQPASNVDFQIEAKFDSAVTQATQIQGLLVQQDADDWLRFDIYSTGSSVKVYAGSTVTGVTSAKVNKVVTAATPFWLRVTRVGDTWTYAYSSNGTTWTTATSFTRVLSVGEVGVYGANSGTGSNVPAYTALVDYFFETAGPLGPEDGGSPTGIPQLNVTAQGSGSVTADPGGPYSCGQSVNLTANPAQGATFQGWSGDLSGSTNPTPVVLDSGRKSVTATFSSSDPPPQISNVQAVPTQTGATVSWTTNEPATSHVDYGPTASYGANVDNPASVTSHSVTLTGLSAGTLYHYRVSSTDSAGGTTSGPDQTFTTLPSGGSTGIRSDDFDNPNLQTAVWAFADPLGGGRVAIEGAGTSNARLAIVVPGGVSHDPFNTNRSVRVMQPADNVDFQIEAKFDSPVTQRYQEQGLLVQQDDNDWLRFDMYSDGTSTKVYAGSTANGATTTKVNTTVPTATPFWLRVTRTGSSWTYSYSTNGTAWTTAVTYSRSLSVTTVGVFGANDGSGTNVPAHTALVDYFFDTAGPISPEDGGPATDTLPPFIHGVSTVGGSTSIMATWATDELATGRVDYGLTTAYELGSISHPGTSNTHAINLTGLQQNTTYHVRLVSDDAGGRRSISGDIPVTTAPTAPTGGPVIDVWYGPSQTFGAPARSQTWINILGNVSDPDGVSSLTYSLNGGPGVKLSRGPDNRRLENPGDFNADIRYADLASGNNTVLLRAVDTKGNVSTSTVTVTVNGSTASLPFAVDWSSVTNIQSVAQIVDGLWQRTSSGPRNVLPGYDRLIALGDMTWQDYEVTVPVTVHSVDTVNGYPYPSNGPVVGLGLRWKGHTAVDSKQPAWGYWPAGAYAWYRWRPDGTERFELRAENATNVNNSAQLQLGTTYLFKFRVETQANGHGLYSFRFWPQGSAEPSTWTFQITGVSDLASGSMLLISHHAVVTFGDLTVTPL